MFSRTSAGYSGPGEVNYLFIDGGCLRSLLKDLSETYFNGDLIELDFAKFTGTFTKVFYYDALPIKRHAETDERYNQRLNEAESFIEKLQMLARFHVYLGESRQRGKKTEQKQVDMLIAIHLLKHTFNRNMHKATLLTTDSDFIPLLDALVEAGMHISLWHGDTKNCKANKELLMAADSRIKISAQFIYQNTTKTFLEKHLFPIVKSSQKEKFTKLVGVIENESVGSVELFEHEENYIVVFKDNSNIAPGYFLHIRHPKFEILRLFVEKEYYINIPEINL